MEKKLVLNNKILKYDEIDKINIPSPSRIQKSSKKINKNKVEYFEIAASFDIETTSLRLKDEKIGFMYIWQFCISTDIRNSYTFIGRTWEEYQIFYNSLVKKLGTNYNLRLVVYIHNLSYEFQFMRKWFTWDSVFSLDERKPIYAVTTEGIEYRCSYMLTNSKLELVSKNLTKYNIKKLVGNLDYKKIRHSKTLLNDDEINYCINDVLVVVALLNEKMIKGEKMATIPLTNTGYVRRYCKQHTVMLNNKINFKYKDLIDNLKLNPKTYSLLKDAYSGGFTHGNAIHSGNTMENVKSFDFTSSYPSVLLSEKYPMSPPKRVSVTTYKDLLKYLESYCCLFDCKIEGLTPRVDFEHIISSSKCDNLINCIEDNGRVVTADSLEITLTDVDFKNIIKFYKIDSLSIGEFYIFKRDYLPKEILECILHFYNGKTTLKGVVGEEENYNLLKGMLNSIYGCFVTDIVRDEYTYIDEWGFNEGDILKSIDSYNEKFDRWLFYPWGVWCTAYARSNLFTGILECGDDYIYSDTDSIKLINYEKHKIYFDKYNKEIRKKINKCLKSRGIDPELANPKTVKGIEKPLGVWDCENLDEDYEYFKFLGAKRYCYKYRGEWHITVAGTGKIESLKYLTNRFPNDKDFLNNFDEDLVIPGEYTGKLTHTYCDYEINGEIFDFNGVKGSFKELSFIHLEQCEYSMSIAKEYGKYLRGIREEIQGKKTDD